MICVRQGLRKYKYKDKHKDKYKDKHKDKHKYKYKRMNTNTLAIKVER